MERLILIYFTTLSCFATPIIYMSENELQIGVELSKKLQTDHCIFIEHEIKGTKLIKYIKAFSDYFILTTFFTPDDVLTFIKTANFIYYSETTAFIFKGSNENGIENLLSSIFNEDDPSIGRIRYLRNEISPYIWFAFLNDQKPMKKPKHMLVIPYDCEFIIIQSNNDISFKMIEIFILENNIFTLEYGDWDLKNGLTTNNEFMYLRRSDLNGTEILMVLFEEEYKLTDSRIDRQVMEILYDMSAILNIRYKDTELNSDNYATLYLDHDVIYGYADYSMFYASYWLRDMNNNPVFKINVNWYIKHPGTTVRSDFYIPPFQKNFWLAIIFSIVIGSILVVIIRRLAPEHEKRYITDDIFIGLEYLCNQCGNDDIKNISLRIASLSLRSIFLIVMASFGAVVTSYLALKIPVAPFIDLEGFLQNGKYKITSDKANNDFISMLMVEYNSVSFDVFNNTYIPLETEKDIDRVCHEKVVYADMNWKIFDQNLSCNIHKIDKPLGYITVFLHLQSSPFRRPFNYRMLKFYESGVSSRMKNIITETSLSEGEENELQQIEFQHMSQVLTIPIIGGFFAALLALLEFVYKVSKIALWKNRSLKRKRNAADVTAISRRIEGWAR